MGSETEKRSEDRHGCDAGVDWAYFNKADFYRAHLLNVSPSGGYFECEQRIIPGATTFHPASPRPGECRGPDHS